MKNKKLLIILSAFILIVIFFVGTKYYKSYEKKRLGFLATENASTFVRDYSPTMGSDDARIYLVEFLDPECESCGKFYPYVKNLMADYKGKIKLVVRYAPFHKNAKFVIKILEAARMQGKYWETLELVFRHLPEWGNHHNPKPELIWTYLPEIGLDVEKIKIDMNDPKIAKMIEQDISDGKKLGVRATPTFFVNGKPLKKFGPQYLKQAIESELKN